MKPSDLTYFGFQNSDPLTYVWQQQYYSATCHGFSKGPVLAWRFLAAAAVMGVCILVDYAVPTTFLWIARFETLAPIWVFATLVLSFVAGLGMPSREPKDVHQERRPAIHSFVAAARGMAGPLAIAGLWHAVRLPVITPSHMGLAGSAVAVAAVDFLFAGGLYVFSLAHWPPILVFCYAAAAWASGVNVYDTTLPVARAAEVALVSLVAALGQVAYCRIVQRVACTNSKIALVTVEGI